MDGDIFRDDDPVQHPRHTGEERVRAAAAVAGEEAVGWDDDGDVGRVPHLLGVGYHLGLGQRHLPGKDLHALDADGAVAGFGGHKAADRVGGLRGVILVQREGAGGGGEGDVGGEHTCAPARGPGVWSNALVGVKLTATTSCSGAASMAATYCGP